MDKTIWLGRLFSLGLVLATLTCIGCGQEEATPGEEEPSCPEATLGCACTATGLCGLDVQGRALVCQEGLCVQGPEEEADLGDDGADADTTQDMSPDVTMEEDLAEADQGEPDLPVEEDLGEPDLAEDQDLAEPDMEDAEDLDMEVACEPGQDGCQCDSGEVCGEGLWCVEGFCEPLGCEPGLEEGCLCDEQGACPVMGLRCGVSGLCEPEPCAAGEEGCACGPHGACGVGLGGAPLSCDEGTCRAERCEPGEPGCACLGGEVCVDSVCEGGLCLADDCRAGEANCICAAGGCGPGLRCHGGEVCIDNTGWPGGACMEDDTCLAGNRCQRGVCVSCSLGSQRCACREDSSCNEGLSCLEGVCVDAQGLAQEPPVSASCYTPCSSDLVGVGVLSACPSDGLMPGCYGGRQCRQGQCLLEGEEPRECSRDLDCPDFQACLAGQCMANCQEDTDCVTGAVCHRQVCRPLCTTAAGCGGDEYCSTTDGENGVCMPNEEGTSVELTPEAFALDVFAVDMDQPERSFTLTNQGPLETTFVLSKVSHRLFGADGQTRELRVGSMDDCEGAQCPLWWMSLGQQGRALSQGRSAEVTLGPGQQTVIVLDEGQGVDSPRWEGEIEVRHPRAGSQSVLVKQSQSVTGAWSGEVYYFANFEDGGVDAWRADRNRVDMLNNAFLRLWANFRRGALSYRQFQAGVTSTRTESWRSSRLEDLGCAEDSVCFPYDNFDGFLTYTTDPVGVAVPSGLVEMPVTMHLRPAQTDLEAAQRCQGRPDCFLGRLESTKALQYAGLPAVSLHFEADPADCTEQTLDGSCITFMSGFDAEVVVGARFATDSQDAECGDLPGFEHSRVPWLITGYVGDSEVDPESGRSYTYQCRDIRAPMPLGNPVHDGQVRRRQIELVDGALINDSQLMIIFRERMDSLLNDGRDVTAYGYMLLGREDRALDPDELQAAQPVPARPQVERPPAVACQDELLGLIGETRARLEAPEGAFPGVADRVALGVLEGSTVDPSSLTRLNLNAEVPHYLCEDTGRFDGGAQHVTFAEQGGDDPRERCPEGSRVTFFTLSVQGERPALLRDCGGRSLADCNQAFVAAQPCQEDGTCGQTLAQWLDNGTYGARQDPIWRCQDANRAFCEDDRRDLRQGKVFFEAEQPSLVFRPLLVDVDDAFRYRVRFQSRQGTQVGFVPQICPEDGSGQVPYCYDPRAIEEVRDRVSCALELYVDHYDRMQEATQVALLEYLRHNFAYTEEVDSFNQVRTTFGFEHLDTELLIMLGDESLTRAAAGRFDLAASRVSSFEGDLFEEDGIRLSGVAGAEMYNLYQAVQYYQVALDRFYDMVPLLARSIERARQGGAPSVITQATVVSYLDRLTRASTQKARAWSEIATRYQNFNRPDLSRAVIERGYTSSYLESVVLVSLLKNIVEISSPEDKAQIVTQIDTAQRSYRVALSRMRQHYEEISDDLNYFGFAPDFIPFPALEHYRDASFEVAFQRAQQRLEIAQQSEDIALNSDRAFNTDSAAFQNELARVESTYENQLSEICGTFEVDGRVYPAISKYAYLSERTRLLGNPCGLLDTGTIHQSLGQVDLSVVNLQRVRTALLNLEEEARIEEQRWNASCNVTNAFALEEFEVSGEIISVQEDIDRTRSLVSSLERSMMNAQTIASLTKCTVGTSSDCGTASISLGLWGSAFAFSTAVIQISEQSLITLENQNRQRQRSLDLKRNLQQCQLVQIDGVARVRTMLLRRSELELEGLRAQYEYQQVLSNIKQQRNQAVRLEQELAEMQQLTINVEAARNNPNYRIYRNDAIINADVTFYSALREIYKATRVLEYYTSQSYGPLEELFLTRLVSRGDFNLRNYMIELEDTYREFEDHYGLPDRRLSRLSLRDDIMAIPRLDEEGAAISDAQRIQMFRERLGDVSLLDRAGYITIPFSTNLDELSPLTRNHKIAHIEAEIIGSDVGDPLGRVYLRMAGTSVVAGLGGGELNYYTFPERTAVINTFFNGNRLYLPEVYQTRRMFDRPYVNTRWELVINKVDEEVNQDINLGSLTDVRLYIYYNDFTEF